MEYVKEEGEWNRNLSGALEIAGELSTLYVQYNLIVCLRTKYSCTVQGGPNFNFEFKYELVKCGHSH